MGENNQLFFPEEDEDLEALRLAALQSLKRKSNNEPSLNQFNENHFNVSPRNKQKNRKFQRLSQGRTSRNGQFNNWTRNSNLIAVPMVNEESEKPQPCEDNNSAKLVLPQDRYCKLEKSPEKQQDATSKFDRYDNSDESESESEEEDLKSNDDDKPELKRANSLEELMAELENEIQGVSNKPEEKLKVVKPKKKRKISVTETETKIESKPLKENLKPEVESVKKPIVNNFRQRKWQGKHRRHVIPPVQNFVVNPRPDLIQPVVPFVPPPPVTYPFAPVPIPCSVYPPVFETPPPPVPPPLHIAPPIYERPLSPLVINTDAYSVNTMAPLSPRSAAFVRENREIIEKRKRRSYSRSPSPRFRRSKSPKRLSLSPKRLSRSRSPKRRSLSPSPVRRVLPPRSNSPKKSSSIHDRLGMKSKEEDKKKDDKKEEILDPVLEARRKKFERNEITMTEGVIRLKKVESAEELKKDEQEQEIDEDVLLEADEDDTIVLDHKIDTLFSDEESDSDNEGRFKTKQKTENQKVAVLPFTKLINGTKDEVKTELSKNERNEKKKRFRSRSPLKKTVKLQKKKDNKIKQTASFPNDRKIEIKIRNPAKYEKCETKEEKSSRKVEVAKKEDEEKKVETEINQEATNNISEGDLRAQLSRKRAERQKHPLPDVIPSRLLQNALQSVGFRKGKKSKNKDENAEGKLPIHLRLGAANNGSDIVGKKARKTKGSQEQV